MNLVSRAKNYAYGKLAKAVERAYTFSAGSSDGGWLSNWMGNGNGSYGAGPHEPFTGAWQRNLDNAGRAGPNLYANSTVFSCITLISRDISSNPIRVLRRRADGSREVHVNHPATALFRKPNEYQTLLQFMQRYIISKLTHGNTYVLLIRDARGVVYSMYVLNPNKVQVLVADDGSIYYRIAQNRLAGVVEEDLIVPARDILHDRGVCLWHDLIGVSPMFAAAMNVMLSGRMQINSERFFANMARTSGILVAPGKIEKEVAKRLQAEWEANYTGAGIGKTAILTNGLDYKPMTINAHDSEVVQQMRWTVEEIARAFQVPPYKIGELSKASFKNNEQMARDYYDGCLRAYIEAAEQCFEKSLEVAFDVEVEFDLSDMFRLDSETRFNAHKLALDAGWLAINEVRALEDYPPVKGGDEPRVQMQDVPLSFANGQLAAQAASPPAPEPTPAPPPPTPAPAPANSGKNTPIDQLELDFLGEQFDLNFSLEN